MKIYRPLNGRWPLVAAAFLTFALLSPMPPAHADPVNEDEWYDPTDWFDGNNYEYDDTYGYGSGRGNDFDAYNYDYGYGYGGYPRSSSGAPDYATRYWHDNYDYDARSADQNRQRQQATAENRRDQQNTRVRTQATGQSQSDQQRVFAGYIDAVREINVRDRKGGRDRFTVVRIRLRDGSTANVDLGQRLALKDVNLDKGEYLRVRGQERTISGQKVILADKILADGREHRITRSERSVTSGQQQTARSAQSSPSSQTNRSAASSQGQSSPADSGPTSLRGTVESFRRINVDGSDDAHTLVKVTMGNGRSQIVDLGPNHTARSLGINAGDYVSIRGNQTRLNERPILRAEHVYADGYWKTVRQTNWWDTDDQQQ